MFIPQTILVPCFTTVNPADLFSDGSHDTNKREVSHHIKSISVLPSLLSVQELESPRSLMQIASWWCWWRFQALATSAGPMLSRKLRGVGRGGVKAPTLCSSPAQTAVFQHSCRVRQEHQVDEYNPDIKHSGISYRKEKENNGCVVPRSSEVIHSVMSVLLRAYRGSLKLPIQRHVSCLVKVTCCVKARGAAMASDGANVTRLFTFEQFCCCFFLRLRCHS